MHLYDEALEQGMTSNQAKHKVLDHLVEAAKKFASDGGLEFSYAGVISPQKILTETIEELETLVQETKNDLVIGRKIKQVLSNLKILQGLVKKK